MTQYADVTRVRAEVPPAPPMLPVAAPRLSIARRPLLDLPLSAAAAGGAGLATDPIDDTVDLDSSVSFDIPAFLRRQEN
jgi:hypothetical protein